ncbi:unnamed protein product [Prorocentrum cordatum]|uniref:Uncharacterized protein n=1 Tax=Prorocentrum cordatum TaxID=2364126 RepID=A0ABN9RP57_9DINO|nr:unnamed protein product [Polarella glacialis]
MARTTPLLSRLGPSWAIFGYWTVRVPCLGAGRCTQSPLTVDSCVSIPTLPIADIFTTLPNGSAEFEEQLVARFAQKAPRGRDLVDSCPWGSASGHTDGLLAGRWAPTPAADLPAFFTEDEIASLRGTNPADTKNNDCLPDGHAQHPGVSQASSLEPLSLHWSACAGGACQGIRGVARWMAAAGLRGPLLFVGDSVTRQRHAAAVCDLIRSGCVLRESRGPKAMQWECEEGEGRVSLRMSADLRFVEVSSWSGALKRELNNSVRIASSVVLANIGLHGTGYLREVLGILLNASRDDPSTRIVWAETTATHFEYEAGYYRHQVECLHADLMRGTSTCNLPADLWCSPFDIRAFGNSIGAGG